MQKSSQGACSSMQVLRLQPQRFYLGSLAESGHLLFFQSNPGGSDAGGAQVILGEILGSGYQVSLNEEPPPSQEAWLQLVGFCFSGAIDKEECFRAVSSRTELFFVLAFNGNWRYLFFNFYFMEVSFYWMVSSNVILTQSPKSRGN